MKNLKLSVKMVGGFVCVAVITLVVGFVGQYGIGTLGGHVEVLGDQALPNVQNLLTIDGAQTQVMVGERALINPRMMKPELRQGNYKYIDDAFADADAAWKVYEPLERTPEEDKYWKQFVSIWDEWKKGHEEIVRISKEQGRLLASGVPADDTRIATLDDQMFAKSLENRKAYLAAEAPLREVIMINEEIADAAVKQADADAVRIRMIMMVGMIVGAIVAIALGVFLSVSITRPINRIIRDLSSGAEQVAAASGQVSASSQSAAQGASEQASSLEETSSALEEMASMGKTNAENAGQANTLMSDTTQIVDQGQNVMGQTSDAMERINDASGKIANIIKVIEEIAFQTNLLALNAAVEAARAGEHGKGFAVVADEVRNLAQRSAQAANETSQLIQDTIERVKKGSELNEELGHSFGKVNESASHVASLVEQISSASQEQAKGIDQVNAAMGQMDQVVQQSAAGAEESASASEELSSQAQVLRQTVDQLAALVGGTHATASDSALMADVSATKSKQMFNASAVATKTWDAKSEESSASIGDF